MLTQALIKLILINIKTLKKFDTTFVALVLDAGQHIEGQNNLARIGNPRYGNGIQ